ncbi:MAG: hypothetical protein JXA15_07875 [Spirochaetales bacterium]|nr:hypothetical protein [Spirochaetales bacterium]
MDRMTRSGRHPALAAFVSVCLLAALAATCDNPIDIVAEVQREVMLANDRFLEINEITVPKDLDNLYNPAESISIVFDRDVDLGSFTPSTVRVVPEGGVPLAWEARSLTYLPASRIIKLRVLPVLESQTTFNLTIDGVRGLDGSTTDAPVSITFETDDVLAGYVTEWSSTDASSNPGYTKTATIDLSIAVNDMYRYVCYELMIEGKENWPAAGKFAWVDQAADGASFDWNGLDLTTLGAVDEEPARLLVRFFGRAEEFGTVEAGTEDAVPIVMDRLPPATPSVPALDATDDSGVSSSDGLTNRTTGLTFLGTGEPDSTISIKAGATSYGSKTAAAGGAWSLDVTLPAGSHAVYATSTDAAGNTAESGTIPITVDVTPPTFSGLYPTGTRSGLSIIASVAAIDANGVEQTAFSIGGISKGIDTVPTGSTFYATIPWDTSALGEDTKHTVLATAIDRAGNTASVSGSVTIGNFTIGTAFDFRDLGMAKAGSVSALALAPLASEKGHVYIVYRDDYNDRLRFVISLDGGERWEYAKADPGSLKSINPAMAVDPDGSVVHLVFGNGTKLYHAMTDDLAQSWTTVPIPGALDVDPTFAPLLAMDPRGDYIHVIFKDADGYLAGACSSDGGSTFTAYPNLIYDKAAVDYHSAAINEGGVQLVWRTPGDGRLYHGLVDMKTGAVIEVSPDPITPAGHGYRLSMAAQTYRDYDGFYVNDMLFVSGAGENSSDFVSTWMEPKGGTWVSQGIDGKKPFVEGTVAANAVEQRPVYHAAYYCSDSGYLSLAKTDDPGKEWYSYELDRIPNRSGRGPSMASDGVWTYISYYNEDSQTLNFLKASINVIP